MQKEAPINKILSKLDNSIGSEAETELNEWRHASKENESFFKAFLFFWDDKQTGITTFQPKTDQALIKVHQRLSRLQFIRQTIKTAAVFIALISVGSVLWLLKPENKTIRIIATTQQETLLPDSTRVILAKGSELIYPESFKAAKRTVKLNGKAWFDVVHDPEHPFIVETHKAYTKVLGTQFTITAKDNTPTAVFLDQGKVSFKPKQWLAQKQILEPGEMISYSNGAYHKTKQHNLNASSWATYQLKFKSTALDDVILELKAYYNVDIELQTAQIGQLRFSGTIKDKDPYNALEIIALTLKLKLIQNENTFILSL
ncbi:FecR domain-containing protein [Carboxylicivirga sp. A043]|uniref:FecR family protein n=1 Tax=Carboxylicivirga litoralis TaxID=2816963 RepID=UPI0021CB7014|nr:FecR domain-containing protein [Carboxylicivirga sp. A043]MCU4156047.1 FecR domain-containing protein [Carboxylicivirga sp. A043]